MSIEFFDDTYNVNPYSVWTVWAENHGSRDAHGVEVLLDRVNPITGKVYYKFIGSSTGLHDQDALDFKDIDYVKLDSGSGVWRVGTLPAGSRKGARLNTRWEWTGGNAPPVTGEPGPNTGRIPVPLTAEISNPRYQDPLPENNKATAWAIIRKTAPTNFTRAAFATLLEAKADNLRPDNKDGQAVDFTLKLDNPGTKSIEGYLGPVWSLLSDVTLDITLSGLKVKTAPTSTELNGTTIECKDSGTANDPLDTCADDDNYAEWDIGFLFGKSPLFDASSKPILKDCFGTVTTNDEYICRQLTLKLALDGDMPLSERCLEARIRSNPPPEDWRGALKVCLGVDDPPRLLLEDEQVDLFTLYPCVGTDLTAYPCNSDDTDSLEVVAGTYLPLDFTRRSDILGDPAASVHVRNVNSGKALLQPATTNVFIQVKDPGGRHFDSQQDSLNAGTVVSWHTRRDPYYTWKTTDTNWSRYFPNRYVDVPGVHLTITAAPFYDERTDWGKLTTLTGVGGLKNDGSLPPQANISCAVPTDNTLPTGLPTLPPAPGDVYKRQMYSGYTDGNHKTSYAGYPWFKSWNLNYLEVGTNARPYDRFFEFEKLGTYVLYYHASGKRSSSATLKPSQTFCDTARYVFHVGPVAELEVTGEKAGSSYTVTAQNHGPDPAENAQVKLNVTGVRNAKASVGCFDSSTGVWGLSQKWNATDSKCEDQPYNWLPGADDPRFHPDDKATLTFTGSYSSLTADIYNKEQCVNAAGAAQSATTELACIYSSATTTPPTRSGNHWGSYQVCVDYDGANLERTADAIYVVNNVRQPIEDENDCTAAASDATYDVGTVYDYNELNNSVTLGVPPGQVGVITAGRQSTDENRIDLSWTAPTGLPKATGYDVEYQSRTGNSGSWGNVWTRAATEITGTSYTFENAGGGTSYRFRARAVTASNPDNLTGNWRTSSVVRTVSSPDQVGNLQAARKADDASVINVSWSAPSGGTTPTGYDVQYQVNYGSWTTATSSIATTTYQFGGASGASSYRFRVRTVTVSGGDTIHGSWRYSDVVPAVPAPKGVGGVLAERDTNDDTIIDVSWDAPTSGTPPTSYVVHHRKDGVGWATTTTTTATTTQLTGATGKSSYRFRVQTVTVSGTGTIYGKWEYSNTVQAVPRPGQVGNLTATRATDETVINVSWATSSRATGQTTYEVQHRKDGSAWDASVTATTTATSYRLTGAAGGSRYVFRVRAVTTLTSGTRLEGSWRTSSTVRGLPAGNIASVTATRDTSDKTVIHVEWATSSLAVKYNVQYRKNNGGWSNATTTSASARNHTQTNAGGVETYKFRVRGVSDAGNGAWTESATVQPPPLEYHGADVGVDYITLKVASGPWWFEYRDHKADWSSCRRVASGSYTLTNLRATVTYLFDLYESSGCSADQFGGRLSLRTLSDVYDWDKCWNTDDCRSIDSPNDMSKHTHKRSQLAQFGVTISGCDWSTRVFHTHGWPDGGWGQHWHCQQY